MIITKRIMSIPSSFVAQNMKKADDLGSGESKLFVGPLSKEVELDNFFEFGSNYTYSISKNNLRDYLLQVKFEYVYHKFNNYKKATLESWNQNLQSVVNLPSSTINIELVKFKDKARYYVRSETEEFKRLLRSIALPKITDLVFQKDDQAKTIEILLELNLSCDQANSEDEKNLGFSDGQKKFNFRCELPRNRIVFGAPGTGKSFLINTELKQLLDNFNVDSNNYERVTFHPDYSYANFVGTYKPVMVEHNSNQSVDSETKNIIDILSNPNTDAQYKYDSLFDTFNDKHATRVLPILVGIYNKDIFKQKNKDNTEINNNYEGGQGRIISKYVSPFNNKNENSISYQYVPGPFMRMYVKALKNAENVANGTEEARPFILIIEEINRANVAAVFGDIFQLLDRDDNHISEYPIQASEDIKKYLAKEFNRSPEDFAQITIPNNLFIWATMNSADQGVFPMDTAFKRRWDFTYLGINDKASEIANQSVYLNNKKIYWNGLRMAINDYLAKIGINEDKQLGPYFLKKDVISDKDKFSEVFKHKIIMYLFEDAAKQKRASLFSGLEKENLRYSIICEEFDKRGIEIFNKEIQDKCNKYDPAEYALKNDEEY